MKPISAKEELFCEYLKILHSPREAAARAGYPFPERNAVRLLKKEGIRQRISEETKGGEAISGLRRIAFGGISDVVWLCERGEIPSREELEKLDLFMVSELKFNKSGGIEVKFFDRLKALDLLSEQQMGEGGRAEPFFRALGCSAARITAPEEERDGV